MAMHLLESRTELQVSDAGIVTKTDVTVVVAPYPRVWARHCVGMVQACLRYAPAFRFPRRPTQEPFYANFETAMQLWTRFCPWTATRV